VKPRFRQRRNTFHRFRSGQQTVKSLQIRKIFMSNDLFRIAFMEMRCLEETSELSASDEPYVLFFTADLRGPIPKTALNRTKVFEGTDKGTLDKQWVRIWGVDGNAQPIVDPDNVLILVKLMEYDDSDPNDIVTATRAALFGNVLSLFGSGKSHSDIVTQLIPVFNSTARTSAHASALANAGLGRPPNADDEIGSAQELRITQADLNAAKNGTIRKNLTFSGDGGKYRLGFDVAAGA
jgi:hypothetical protein